MKVENSAEKLKDGNLILEANISAYDFALARVKKRVLGAMVAVHTYLGQGVSRMLIYALYSLHG